MSELRTEEEQIAAIKNWWKENGNSLLIGLGVAFAALFGWKAYQNSVIQQKTEASMIYQELVNAATQTKFDQAKEEKTISYLATKLKNKFHDSEYAIYGALFLAKDNVENDKLDAAKTELNWVLSNSEDPKIKQITKARLARILVSEGKNDEALALLKASNSEFEPSYLEIIGDIKLRAGDKAAAIESYKKAYALIKDTPQVQPLLSIKLSDLGINPQSI